MRVVVTNGLNTTQVDSKAFNVATKAPEVYIVSPNGDLVVGDDVPLLLQGHGYDLEDGTLPSESLTWSSDIQGNLGSGTIVLAGLQHGVHTITLTARDSNGMATTATITITVVKGCQLFLPLVMR